MRITMRNVIYWTPLVYVQRGEKYCPFYDILLFVKVLDPLPWASGNPVAIQSQSSVPGT